MRITGLSGSGLDIDAIVSETMQTYELKVTDKEKEKALLELKQSMYQDIIESGQNFYDKYFNLTSANSLSLSSTYATTSFSSSNSDAVSVKGLSGAEKDNYKVSVTQLASAASTTINSENIKAGQTITLTMGELSKTFTLEGSNESEITKNLNTALSEAGFNMSAKYSDFANSGAGGLKLQSSELGEDVSFTVKVGDAAEEKISGQNAIVSITNGSGETIEYKGSANKATFDNVQFTFNSTTVSSDGIDSPVSVTGKTDVSSLKETIVNFVNDYNSFITDLNTKLRETRDSDYMPLTDDEKAAMSEDEIKRWEEKVKTGIFRNDTDLSRIASNMKSAMKTMMSSTGLTLESIGISPVNDYTTKSGTYTIDESKLTEALENNLEGVKELFLSEETTTTLPNGSSYTSGGIATSLTSTLKNEFILSSKSSLIKKAGTKNNALTSTIKTELSKKQEVIDKMKDALTERETKLYSKYSALETALSNLYSQQTYISSLLGTE